MILRIRLSTFFVKTEKGDHQTARSKIGILSGVISSSMEVVADILSLTCALCENLRCSCQLFSCCDRWPTIAKDSIRVGRRKVGRMNARRTYSVMHEKSLQVNVSDLHPKRFSLAGLLCCGFAGREGFALPVCFGFSGKLRGDSSALLQLSTFQGCAFLITLHRDLRVLDKINSGLRTFLCDVLAIEVCSIE